MTNSIDELIGEERLAEAAELCAGGGDHARASLLFERACMWDRAAASALDAGDAERALDLAITAINEAISNAAFARVSTDDAMAVRSAERLARRSEHAWAARLYEAARRTRDAALAWNRAGDAARAAELLESNGEPAEAARVLEAALRRSPADGKAAVALGALLLRYGKSEAATRALQSVARGASERSAALVLLMQAFTQMGLAEAAREANEELTLLGGASSSAMPNAARFETKARLFGRYDIVREVASTASARVLECVDVVRQETVAMKLFASEARAGGRDALARFEREIKALAALDHPNVVPMRDYFPDGPALVMEWMSGGTLEAMMKRTTIAPARAIEIACAVLSALAEAHRVEILHRDVKPANVLFDGAGVTRLGDFGVAHLGDLSATATAGVIGTVAYMSPEQRRGEPATAESDVYGVGAILFEMLTGENVASEAPTERLPSGAHRDLNAQHDKLVLAMIEANAIDRPHSALDARRALLSVKWPTSLEPAAPRRAIDETSSGAEKKTARLQMDEQGNAIDSWIERAIERVKLDEATRTRASLFARAGHPSLQTIYRIDRSQNELWLELLLPWRSEIEPKYREDLTQAIETIRAIGGGDFPIDEAHVGARANGEPVIRFALY